MVENERKLFPTPITIVMFGSPYTGKTTLTHMFNEKLHFSPIKEDWQKNPYLHCQDNHPLDNQVWYLKQATEAMLKAKELNKRGESVVLDTFVYSTLIFSKIFLTDRDFIIFNQLFNSLVPKLPVPDLLIYLRANADFLYNKRRITRINKGGGPKTDLSVSQAWLEKSCQLHDLFITGWKQSPKVEVDIEKRDFLHKNIDFEDLVRDMQTKLG